MFCKNRTIGPLVASITTDTTFKVVDGAIVESFHGIL